MVKYSKDKEMGNKNKLRYAFQKGKNHLYRWDIFLINIKYNLDPLYYKAWVSGYLEYTDAVIGRADISKDGGHSSLELWEFLLQFLLSPPFPTTIKIV